MKNKILVAFFLLISTLLVNFQGGHVAAAAEKVNYDVIVIGGEPEGIAAALSAARSGAKTLLIEERDGLGGLFTYGMMNFLDFPKDRSGKMATKGIFQEWHRKVGGGLSFVPEKAGAVFLEMVKQQPNLYLSLNTKVVKAIVEDSKIKSIVIDTKGYKKELRSHTYIDATQDADFAVLSGVPYFLGAADVGFEDKQMAVTLMIHLQGLDWNKIKQTAKSGKFGSAQVTNEGAWGFAKLRDIYKPVDPNMRLRGFNLAKNEGGYYINALQIFGVDGLDPQSKLEGIERGKKETVHILEWLKVNFPGFENAKIASFPKELYVRETRHIKSLYQLPVSDLWENKYHWDTIAYGAYPADIQAVSIDDPGAIVVNPDKYGIPFRSLVPQNMKNLLVVGRSGGYSSLAAGSVRIVATGMGTGEAAGVAAKLAVQKGLTFDEMAANKAVIKELQSILHKKGALVSPFTANYPYQDAVYYPAIRELLNARALYGNYNNNVGEKEIATNFTFTNILKQVFLVMSLTDPKYKENIEYITKYNLENASIPLTRDEVNRILSELPHPMAEIKVSGTNKMTRGEMYTLLMTIFNWS
ncbi:FAD-dependent oxidoreductase [Calidifontibacillus erzurumensis]|uniref:FAD-dependent oxidoreductase n=1 Tax=Calidifontibacillus erzurumensis TaxID=2741433 RepID=A0A8J8GH72_9BACI|nr:FAD-dependent oxidoreductase [Calidifontibacillus erzurumensis]NSL53324.1 FAD-dependent oxidoreductase [Calidifontibacillus erzurumensis]